MRSVGIVLRQVKGGAPALVAAALLGAAGCAEEATNPPVATSGASGGPVLAGSASSLPNGCSSSEVPTSSGGVPATTSDICALEAEPVVSNAAARVTLALAGGDWLAPAKGTVTLAAELREEVRGAPAIDLIAASNPALLEAQLSPLQEEADGYTFTVTWPKDVVAPAYDAPHVEFRTALDVACGPGARLVEAATEVRLCGGNYLSAKTWASPGDTCIVCNLIQPAL